MGHHHEHSETKPKKGYITYLIVAVVILILGIFARLSSSSILVLILLGYLVTWMAKTGELKRLFDNWDRSNKINNERRSEDRKSWERRQAELRHLRENEREKEIGRREAEAEGYRREQIRSHREMQRQEAERRRTNFLNNPLGIGTGKRPF